MGRYLVYYDSGTTNSRGYLLVREGQTLTPVRDRLGVLVSASRRVGSKDAAAAGDNRVLLSALWEIYGELLRKIPHTKEDGSAQTADSQVEGIYASGMITCPSGLKEIPHLPAPVGLAQLREGMTPVREPVYFGRDIVLIPGIRTAKILPLSLQEAAAAGNMRGEELEIFGLLSSPGIPAQWRERPMAVALPGSHTHIAYLEGGQVADIFSTFSGELYHAVTSQTILSSLNALNPGRRPQHLPLLPDMVWDGYTQLEEWGFSRALYIARSYQLFTREGGDAPQIFSYLEGVINGGVVQGYLRWLQKRGYAPRALLLAGRSRMSEVLRILLIRAAPEQFVAAPDHPLPLALAGFLRLMEGR